MPITIFGLIIFRNASSKGIIFPNVPISCIKIYFLVKSCLMATRKSGPSSISMTARQLFHGCVLLLMSVGPFLAIQWPLKNHWICVSTYLPSAGRLEYIAPYNMRIKYKKFFGIDFSILIFFRASFWNSLLSCCCYSSCCFRFHSMHMSIFKCCICRQLAWRR